MNNMGLTQFTFGALYLDDLIIADAEEPCNDKVDSAAVKCNRRQIGFKA